MASRTLDYTGVTAAQLRALRQALAAQGITVQALSSPQGETGQFASRGYVVRYRFAPTGDLFVEVSGIRMFLDRAVGTVDSLIQPFLTVT